MAGGRPTLYEEKYCDQIIKHLSDGRSLTSFAAKIGVNLDTIYEWAKVHPEFSEAKKTAMVKCQDWWEEQGRDGLWEDPKGKKLNSTVWIFNMKCRFGYNDGEAAKEVQTPGFNVTQEGPNA